MEEIYDWNELKNDFKIDFNKVKSIEDVIAILKAIDPTISFNENFDIPEKFKPLVKRNFLIKV